MPAPEQPLRRNLFEIENARSLNRDELVATFVPTGEFWRLLSPKNHIILGARGSGKTALLKMLSHDHLSRMKDKRAIDAIESKAVIGLFCPTRLEWVGGLTTKLWQNQKEAELHFQRKLNIASCFSAIRTIRSCIYTYVTTRRERIDAEIAISNTLGKWWSDKSTDCDTLDDLQNLLEFIDLERQAQLARFVTQGGAREITDPAGSFFDTELFVPLRNAISTTNKVLGFAKDTYWHLCIDEAEFLEPQHHKILNSHLRTYSGNLCFKITTMPYFHHTLDTMTSAPLEEGHDFEYVYIDYGAIWSGARHTEAQSFANNVFDRRVNASQLRKHQEAGRSVHEGLKFIKLSDLCGRSILLDSKTGSWSDDYNELLERHGSKETIDRAEQLVDSPGRFQDQITRKILGALLLKESVQRWKGHGELDVYSGASMVVRCADGNPRRLIRIFNALLMAADLDRSRVTSEPLLSSKVQTRVLRGISTSALNRVQSEERVGRKLYEMLRAIGNYMRDALHKQTLATDQITSVSIDSSISDADWTVIKHAVALGLLYPNISGNNPEHMPYKDGVFHLAYILAPHFLLLPRRGKSRDLVSILEESPADSEQTDQLFLDFDSGSVSHDQA